MSLDSQMDSSPPKSTLQSRPETFPALIRGTPFEYVTPEELIANPGRVENIVIDTTRFLMGVPLDLNNPQNRLTFINGIRTFSGLAAMAEATPEAAQALLQGTAIEKVTAGELIANPGRVENIVIDTTRFLMGVPLDLNNPQNRLTFIDGIRTFAGLAAMAEGNSQIAPSLIRGTPFEYVTPEELIANPGRAENIVIDTTRFLMGVPLDLNNPQNRLTFINGIRTFSGLAAMTGGK